MIEAFWFTVNTLIGVPVALVLIMLAREILRGLVALAFGFRVFEIKWGLGRTLATKPIGPIELVRAALPVGASIRAESGRAKHHRLGRFCQAGVPVSIQLVVAFVLQGTSAASFDGLGADLAPLASLRLANLILIIVHGLIAIESADGDSTDIRRILDLAFGPTAANRHARACYYARYARHWLERGEAARAIAILEQGVTQLAHDPLVVACRDRVIGQDLRSVVDQGACSRALQVLIEEDAPLRRESARDGSFAGRLRRSAISALPLVVVGLIAAAFDTESIARFAHQRMLESSAATADRDRPDDCADALVRWARWTPLIDWRLSNSAETLRDRHTQLARLEACRGRLEAALAHQDVAIEAADQALSRHTDANTEDADRRLLDEVRRAAMLRRTAEFESRRTRYRVALATLARAAFELDTTRKRLASHTGSAEREDNEAILEDESERIQIARSEILARMTVN